MTSQGSLKHRLLEWISGGATGAGGFPEFAMEVFRQQFSRNAAYRNYCESRGATPDTVKDWRSIPAVPTDAFKFPEHPLRGFPAEDVKRHFLTSGTTREIRGRHEFEDLELYEASILAGWKFLGLPDVPDPWFFSLGPEEMPESSLVWMFEVLRKKAGVGDERWLMGREDFAGLETSAPSVQNSAGLKTGAPGVQMFSTAIGLLRWMEKGGGCPLPEGSWVFETGGYKGLTETLEPGIFRAKVAEFFAIPERRILNEYSMTELSSQFYRWADETAHRGPFWTRVRVIDPETGDAAADGEPGYLEIIDLANLGSVAAIRTQDLAIARGDSEFVLLGRDPGALPRGCSRSADDLLQRR